jgi:hypothetical protein
VSSLKQQLDPTFQDYAARLPATYRANEYREFVELFGTHFVRKVQMGGTPSDTSASLSLLSGTQSVMFLWHLFSLSAWRILHTGAKYMEMEFETTATVDTSKITAELGVSILQTPFPVTGI